MTGQDHGQEHGQDQDGAGRWDALERDLESQLSGGRVSERRASAAEAGRAELASVLLADRLRAAAGRPVVVVARGAGPVRGLVAAVGSDCVRIADGGRETVLALVAVLSVGGLGPEAGSPRAASVVDTRLGLAAALRRLARDRRPVRVVLDTGDVLTGTIDAVAADHVDLAEHASDEPRRRASVARRRVVALAAIAAVSSG